MLKKISKKIVVIIVIVILGGLGGIIADRYLFPYLSTTALFSKYEFFRKSAEDVTVINRTEQVFVKEETSIGKISSQVSSSVVNIISISGVAAKNVAQKETLNGTGTIVTSDGLIMTDLAAIYPENAKYKIMLADGSSYDAEFLGVDSYSNLAFLKINAGNLPVISFGNSDDDKPGEKIIAIGNSSKDYSNRYASGLMSAVDNDYNLAGKSVSFSDKLEGVARADFNSMGDYVGGPVVDYAGQTIGIVGTLTRNNIPEFFIIPSNKVKTVIEKAIKRDFGNSASLGIYFLPISKSVALERNLPVEKGALIFSPSGQQGLAIMAGSPAQKAGLQISDIITAINGQEINAEKSLPSVLYQFKKGDEVELSVLRSGQEMKIKAQM